MTPEQITEELISKLPEKKEYVNRNKDDWKIDGWNSYRSKAISLLRTELPKFYEEAQMDAARKIADAAQEAGLSPKELTSEKSWKDASAKMMEAAKLEAVKDEYLIHTRQEIDGEIRAYRKGYDEAIKSQSLIPVDEVVRAIEEIPMCKNQEVEDGFVVPIDKDDVIDTIKSLPHQ